MKQLYLGTSSYVKPIAFIVQRCPDPFHQGASVAQINSTAAGADANPALMIYDLMTSTTYGLGIPAAKFDAAVWQSAASMLATEKFGLSMQFDSQSSRAETEGLLKRAHILAGEIRFIGKETGRKWEEGDEISILRFAATEYGRKGKVVASEEVKTAIQEIGINKCARESGFDRKNFVRKLVRNLPVKRNSYNEFVRWLQSYRLRVQK
jgi:hypothetical protein